MFYLTTCYIAACAQYLQCKLLEHYNGFSDDATQKTVSNMFSVDLLFCSCWPRLAQVFLVFLLYSFFALPLCLNTVTKEKAMITPWKQWNVCWNVLVNEKALPDWHRQTPAWMPAEILMQYWCTHFDAPNFHTQHGDIVWASRQVHLTFYWFCSMSSCCDIHIPRQLSRNQWGQKIDVAVEIWILRKVTCPSLRRSTL